MDLKVNCGVWGAMFGVPCIVADNFLKLASGDAVKVLLYILRNTGRVVSSEELAANLGISQSAAEDAVIFWQQANVLLSDSYTAPKNIMSQPVSAPVQAPPPAPVPVQPEPVQTAPPVQPAAQTRRTLTPTEITDLMHSEPEMAALLRAAESQLGPLTNTMMNTLIRINCDIGMKAEAILPLIAHLKELGRTSPNYIEKVAESWYENGINSNDAAMKELERLSHYNDYKVRIMRLFKINDIAPKNEKMIEQWHSRDIPYELVQLAYERTLEQINELKFPYINKILLSWSANGYRTVTDVEVNEGSYRTSKSGGNAPSDGFDAEKYKIFVNNV